MNLVGINGRVVVADAGLPIPPGVQRIDLALTPGIPTLMEILAAMLQELKIERVVIAQEMKQRSPQVYQAVTEMFAQTHLDEISHNELKERSKQAVAVVRSGECTPYANVILVAGVIF